MGIFRRDKPAVADARTEVLAWISRSTVPCVELKLVADPGDVTSSRLGGTPYLPHGTSWPRFGDTAALFVGQFDFGAVPPLPDFPDAGLLQWFVADDDVLGVVFDDRAGSVGFEVRWYPDPTPEAASAATVDRPGIGLEFAPGRCLPAWSELDDATRHLDLWGRYAVSVGEDVEDVAFVYEEYVRGASSPDPSLTQGSRIGGSATFVQDDPRGTATFAAADDPAGRLLVELEDGPIEWGDAGIAHLFGDPAALARGDLSSVRYQWDCS